MTCEICQAVYLDYLTSEEVDTVELSEYKETPTNPNRPRKKRRIKSLSYLAKCPNRRNHEAILQGRDRCAKVESDDLCFGGDRGGEIMQKKLNAALRIVENRLKDKGELVEWRSHGFWHRVKSYAD